VAAAAVLAVCAVVLIGQSVRGNRTVTAQLRSGPVRDARIDDAFYHCLDVQARSLVGPDEPVTLAHEDLADAVTLLKAVGSWIVVADPATPTTPALSLRDGVPGDATCRGTVVVATSTGPGGTPEVRIGSGARVPGEGPPPAPPL
jgi:hypothetical protein